MVNILNLESIPEIPPAKTIRNRDITKILTIPREGPDGPWSTFQLRIGTPPQYIHVLPSTSSSQTWAIAPEGCPSSTQSATCSDARGGLFRKNTSTTWSEIGLYSLALEGEKALGVSGAGDFGYDTVGLGLDASQGPALNSIVGGIATPDFYLGVFGLSPNAQNFSSFADPLPSFLSTLKSQGWIPSLAWGYTAGARYRLKKVLGGLVLGGYDASRFAPNPVVFTFADDTSRELVVAIRGIATSSSLGNETSQLLGGAPFLALIDSTLPYLWLPRSVCSAFEDAFGLTWDPTTSLYLVNDTQHTALTTLNPSITFTLSNSLSGSASVDIVLPYAAFDLTATYPLTPSPNATRYFPLKRADNETQYTLGRAFLQEASLPTLYRMLPDIRRPSPYLHLLPQNTPLMTPRHETPPPSTHFRGHRCFKLADLAIRCFERHIEPAGLDGLGTGCFDGDAVYCEDRRRIGVWRWGEYPAVLSP